jgi:hypothetical protein
LAAVLETRDSDVRWGGARKAHGDAASARTLIELLFLHRHMDGEQVVGGVDDLDRLALLYGGYKGDEVGGVDEGLDHGRGGVIAGSTCRPTGQA